MRFLFTSLLFFSFFISAHAQEYYNMMIQQNKRATEKIFVSENKIKYIQRTDFCPNPYDEACAWPNNSVAEMHYNKEGNLEILSNIPGANMTYYYKYIYENHRLAVSFDSSTTSFNSYWWSKKYAYYKYDTTGNVIEKENADKSIYGSWDWRKKTYIYENGRLTKIQRMEKGNDSLYQHTGHIEFSFDANGFPYEETHYSKNGDKSDKYLYAFDKNGNFLQVKHLSPGSQDTSLLYAFAYNSTGDTLSYTSKEDNKLITLTHQYNEKGQKTGSSSDNTYGTYKISFEFNDDGRLSRKATSWSGKTNSVVYMYNEKGLLSEEKFLDEKNVWTFSNKYSYEYY